MLPGHKKRQLLQHSNTIAHVHMVVMYDGNCKYAIRLFLINAVL